MDGAGWGDGWLPGRKGWRPAAWTVRQKRTEHCCLSDKIIAQHKQIAKAQIK